MTQRSESKNTLFTPEQDRPEVVRKRMRREAHQGRPDAGRRSAGVGSFSRIYEKAQPIDAPPQGSELGLTAVTVE
jgi:hypothetical protein